MASPVYRSRKPKASPFWQCLFRHIPLIVCTTFLISLIEALYILPAHLAHQKDLKPPHFIRRWRKATGKISGRKMIRFRDDSGKGVGPLNS